MTCDVALRMQLAGSVFKRGLHVLGLSGRERRIALEILGYLMRHPDAKDSVTGIRLSWLDEPGNWTEQEVQRVTEVLVARGMIRTWESGLEFTVLGPTEEFLKSPEAFIREFRSYA
jgi:hypothetical protein